MIKTVTRAISKFWGILNRHQRTRVFELIIIMLIGGFLEMFSVSLVIPFVQAIIYPDKMVNNPTVQVVMKNLRSTDYNLFLGALSLGVAFLFLLKNAYLIFQITVQEKFVRGNEFITQKQLVRSIISKPYEFFLGVQSGEIMRIVSEDTDKSYNCLSMLLSLISDLIISIILIVTIFAISPMITLAISIILVSVSVIIYKASRKSLRINGLKEVKAIAAMNQIVLQIVQGIKEIKLMRKEDYFQSAYEKNGEVLVRTRYWGQMLSVIPRYLLEAAAMCSFFVVVAVMIIAGVEIEWIIPTLSGVAMAAIRLLPAINRISSTVSRLTYYEPAVDKMIETLRIFGEIKEADENNEHMIAPLKNCIAVENMSYKYPGGSMMVLDDAQLIIHKGESVGLVGASGAGKTTAVDLILGLLRPQEGHVKIDGVDIMKDIDGWLSQLAYIPQTIFMIDGNIRENVAFGVPETEIDDNKVWRALEEASLDAYVKGLPDGLETEIGERGIRLSGGQRQRIGIARALYTEPEVLFLDEATSALDTDTEAAIMESIVNLQGKITMIIIAHRLTTIEGCDAIYRVVDGKFIREYKD